MKINNVLQGGALCRHPEFISGSSRFSLGFTLMEMLLVVLIVGILTAVALPMYQRAVYKSRFSKLMLPAKTLASANEAFFLRNGEYATAVASLDVGGNTASLPDGSTVDLQNTDAVSFVRLSNAEVPHARYVVYQQKSANFPGTTMCEAEGEDDKALWLCDKGLNGTFVEDAEGNSGIEEGWSAYLLTGSVGVNEHFTVLRNCEGEAPSETTQCSSGCGSVTVTAMCDTRSGQWEELPEPDLSSCQDKPDDQTTSCDTGYTGNKTKIATCTDGTWILPAAWNESACVPTHTIKSTSCNSNNVCTSTYYDGMTLISDPNKKMSFDYCKPNGSVCNVLSREVKGLTELRDASGKVIEIAGIDGYGEIRRIYKPDGTTFTVAPYGSTYITVKPNPDSERPFAIYRVNGGVATIIQAYPSENTGIYAAYTNGVSPTASNYASLSQFPKTLASSEYQGQIQL